MASRFTDVTGTHPDTTIHDFVTKLGDGKLYKKLSNTLFQLDPDELRKATAAEKNFYSVEYGEAGKKIRRRRETDTTKTDIMMMLDVSKLPQVQAAFKKNENGLDLSQFVATMTEALYSNGVEDTDLVSKLCDLFIQVDIDNDGTMNWDEFYHYIHQQGMTYNLELQDLREYQCGPFLELENMEKRTEKMFGFPYTDWLATTEANGSVLRIYDLKKMARVANLNHEAAILKCFHINERRLLCVSACDHFIYIWDSNSPWEPSGFALLGRCRAPVSQTALCYDAANNHLFSGGVDGTVLSWELSVSSGKSNSEPKLKLVGHKSTVKFLLDAPALNAIFSAGLDSSIRLWDKGTGKLRKKFVGHSKGVLFMDYAAEYRILVSSSAENIILVWNPFVDRPLFTLKGHNAPMVGLHIVPNTPQMVSADRAGVLKVWDIRSCDCVQSMKCVRQLDFISTFLTQPQYNRIICGNGRNIQTFDFSKSDRPELTDDYPIVLALYNQSSSSFLTLSSHHIREWDANTGEFKAQYAASDVTQGEFSAGCLDQNQRKLFVGDSTGKITCLHYGSGVKIKEFEPHKSEVSKLMYCTEDKTVISASWDGNVCVHDDQSVSDDGLTLLRSMKGHTKDIHTLAYSWRLKLLASAGADFNVVVWASDYGKVEKVLQGHTSDLTYVSFLDPFPLLISTDLSGAIAIWVMPPSYLRFQLLLVFYHSAEAPPSRTPFPSPPGNFLGVSTAIFDHTNNDLIIGDENGNITTYDLGPLLSSLPPNITPVPPIRLPTPDELKHRRRAHVKISVGKSATDTSPPGSPGGHSLSKKFDFSLVEKCSLLVSADLISVDKKWAAHEGVIQIEIVRPSGGLVSIGVEKLVKIWSSSGSLLGVLRQGEDSGLEPWRFETGVSKKVSERSRLVTRIMQALETQKYNLPDVAVSPEISDTESQTDGEGLVDISSILSPPKIRLKHHSLDPAVLEAQRSMDAARAALKSGVSASEFAIQRSRERQNISSSTTTKPSTPSHSSSTPRRPLGTPRTASTNSPTKLSAIATPRTGTAPSNLTPVRPATHHGPKNSYKSPGASARKVRPSTMGTPHSGL